MWENWSRLWTAWASSKSRKGISDAGGLKGKRRAEMQAEDLQKGKPESELSYLKFPETGLTARRPGSILKI
jgi:hypothetical protein